jgi:hypothetical protein
MQELSLSLSMGHAGLPDVLEFALRDTWWTRLLPAAIKTRMVITWIKMLNILQQQKPTHFARSITVDEPWLFLDYPKNCVWKLHEKNAPERISRKIDTEEPILTLFWSTIAPLVEDLWPMNASFNSEYFCGVIISHLSGIVFPNQTGPGER